jgi:hypothetical protein
MREGKIGDRPSALASKSRHSVTSLERFTNAPLACSAFMRCPAYVLRLLSGNGLNDADRLPPSHGSDHQVKQSGIPRSVHEDRHSLAERP